MIRNWSKSVATSSVQLEVTDEGLVVNVTASQPGSGRAVVDEADDLMNLVRCVNAARQQLHAPERKPRARKPKEVS